MARDCPSGKVEDNTSGRRNMSRMQRPVDKSQRALSVSSRTLSCLESQREQVLYGGHFEAGALELEHVGLSASTLVHHL